MPLLALGLAVVFSVLGMINFAHGEILTIAGYTVFFAIIAVPPILIIPLAPARRDGVGRADGTHRLPALRGASPHLAAHHQLCRERHPADAVPESHLGAATPGADPAHAAPAPSTWGRSISA